VNSCNARAALVQAQYKWLLMMMMMMMMMMIDELSIDYRWIYGLIDRSIDRSIDWLIDWLIHSFIHSFIHWLIGRSFVDLQSYALSVRVLDEKTNTFSIKHYRIRKFADGRVCVSEKIQFQSVVELVAYYRGERLQYPTNERQRHSTYIAPQALAETWTEVWRGRSRRVSAENFFAVPPKCDIWGDSGGLTVFVHFNI